MIRRYYLFFESLTRWNIKNHSGWSLGFPTENLNFRTVLIKFSNKRRHFHIRISLIKVSKENLKPRGDIRYMLSDYFNMFYLHCSEIKIVEIKKYSYLLEKQHFSARIAYIQAHTIIRNATRRAPATLTSVLIWRGSENK